MIRIAVVVLPGSKHIDVALTAIKGVGRVSARSMLQELGIDPAMKADDLTEAQEKKLRERIEQDTVEGELSRKNSMDVKRLQDIGTWRGYRHRRKLPVRGQTSRRNARTKRGKKKTGGSGRVKLTKT